MEISYDENEDILFIRFNHDPIVRDISYGWHINVGMTATGIGQITILEARTNGTLPIPSTSESNVTLDNLIT